MIWVIFAHFIGDWALQSEWMATNKGKYWFIMFAHCAIWTACVCIALQYTNLFVYCKAVFLFGIHYAVDVWKCSVYAKVPFCRQPTYRHLYIDQGIHLAQCLGVYLL